MKRDYFNYIDLDTLNPDRKYAFIYLAWCELTGKRYIGRHFCYPGNFYKDKYFGSGKRIKKDFKKYGKSFFNKMPIDYTEDILKVQELEESYLTKEWVSDPGTYNAKTAGDGFLPGSFNPKSGKYGKDSSSYKSVSENMLIQMLYRMLQWELTQKEFYDEFKYPSAGTRFDEYCEMRGIPRKFKKRTYDHLIARSYDIDVEKVIRYKETGMTNGEIAEIYGCKQDVIRNRLIKYYDSLGIPNPWYTGSRNRKTQK